MNNTELSIRIGPDGFSFLTRGETGGFTRGQFDSYDFDQIGRLVHSVGAVRIICSVAEVVLVPAEFFAPASAYDYLRAANVWSLGNIALWSFVGGVVVVWAVDEYLYNSLTARYSDAEWVHVQSELCASFEPETLRVVVDSCVVHLALFSDSGLVVARSAKYISHEDLFFMMRRLTISSRVDTNRVVIRGGVGALDLEQLHRYYKIIDFQGDLL